MAIFECVGGVSPTGNALPGDVKAGVTFSNENDVDLVGTFEAQQKTITGSRATQIVTPDEGKYLDQVTVNALVPTGTYTPTSRAENIDMGEDSNYRYITTTSVPNNNTGTYTFAANDTGATKDLGITNTYRYVNASNVYAKGKTDATRTFSITLATSGSARNATGSGGYHSGQLIAQSTAASFTFVDSTSCKVKNYSLSTSAISVSHSGNNWTFSISSSSSTNNSTSSSNSGIVTLTVG